MEFFKTPKGQVIAGAHRYLKAAKLLRYSETWAERPTILQTPTLHLLGHGLELLLKFPLMASGIDQADIKRQFGHRLVALWKHDLNEHVRGLCKERATVAWDEARTSGRWFEDDFDKDPKEELVRAIHSLAWLHGADSDFALRYVVKSPTQAPRPAFLIDVLDDVAERAVKNPTILTETW